MTVAELIGDNVRTRREERGWSQQELGNALAKYLGRPWSRQAVSAAENGRREWRAEDLVAVGLALGVSPGWLTFPKLHDILELPGRSVTVDDMVVVTVTKDTPPLDAAKDTLDLLVRQLDDIVGSLTAAKSKAELATVMIAKGGK